MFEHLVAEIGLTIRKGANTELDGKLAVLMMMGGSFSIEAVLLFKPCKQRGEARCRKIFGGNRSV